MQGAAPNPPSCSRSPRPFLAARLDCTSSAFDSALQMQQPWSRLLPRAACACRSRRSTRASDLRAAMMCGCRRVADTLQQATSLQFASNNAPGRQRYACGGQFSRPFAGHVSATLGADLMHRSSFLLCSCRANLDVSVATCVVLAEQVRFKPLDTRRLAHTHTIFACIDLASCVTCGVLSPPPSPSPPSAHRLRRRPSAVASTAINSATFNFAVATSATSPVCCLRLRRHRLRRHRLRRLRRGRASEAQIMPRAAKNPGVGRGKGGGRPTNPQSLQNGVVRTGVISKLDTFFTPRATPKAGPGANASANEPGATSSSGLGALTPIGIQLPRASETTSSTATVDSSGLNTSSTASPPPSSSATVHPLDELHALQMVAAAHRFALHHAGGEGNCQPYALRDALNIQLVPPRAANLDVTDVRSKCANAINDPELWGRFWQSSSDQDGAPGLITDLRDELENWASLQSCNSLEDYIQKMHGAPPRSTSALRPLMT